MQQLNRTCMFLHLFREFKEKKNEESKRICMCIYMEIYTLYISIMYTKIYVWSLKMTL